jgi:uncharacterized protein YebE (UPF0316 family)
MSVFLGALLIFALRICDVSVGTLRTLYMVRGDRLRAVPLAFAESGIWVVAISRIFQSMHSPVYMLAYAAGFATGTFVGITLERWIASGSILVRVISRSGRESMARTLRQHGFGVTAVTGEGREGEQTLLFVVSRRKRGNELLELVRGIDDGAFVTIDAVQTAHGGYLPGGPGPSGVRK